MYEELTTKRSPAALMWKFVLIEAGALVLYYFATLLGNEKYELYTQFSLSNFLSYQVARLIFLAGAQLALTVFAFFSWYYDEYIVRRGTIIHRYGVLRRKEKVFTVEASANLSLYLSPLGKLLHFGSIRVKNKNSALTLSTISWPERIFDALRGTFRSRAPAFEKVPNPQELMQQTESDRLEFKSSLRFDYRTSNVSRDLERSVMKTVAAFLNSNGGWLVVGVSDARAPLGLENDYKTLQRKDSDGFENHFTQAFNSMIGPAFRDLIKLHFQKVDNRDICMIQALASPRPVYLKVDDNEHFYIRTGNISTSLKLSEVESYSRSRWPNAVVSG